MNTFKFLQTNHSTNYVDVGNVRFDVGQPEPPFGLSRRHWNILPQDLRGTTLQEMDCYIRGWEAARQNDMVNPYHDRIRGELWNRGFWNCMRRTNNYTRECAVITPSIRDFNNWRNETFDRSSVFIITIGDFAHTNGNNNITTRYRSISHVHECRGLMFDDYITTRRTNELLNSIDEYHINHINEVINEVRLQIRQR